MEKLCRYRHRLSAWYGLRTVQIGESIILNEKEVMCLPSLDGELEDRISLLDGIVYTNTSMNQIISEGGWEYGRKL